MRILRFLSKSFYKICNLDKMFGAFCRSIIFSTTIVIFFFIFVPISLSDSLSSLPQTVYLIITLMLKTNHYQNKIITLPVI